MPERGWGDWGGSRRPTMAETRLTKGIAEQLLADEEPVDINEFAELDDDDEDWDEE